MDIEMSDFQPVYASQFDYLTPSLLLKNKDALLSLLYSTAIDMIERPCQ